MVRALTTDDELRTATEIIRESFKTVAEEFGADQQTWPMHPAFITCERVQKLQAEGLAFYALFHGAKQVGIVGIRKLDGTLYSLEKLAVLPQHRHQGCGKSLIDFVCQTVREKDGRTIRLALIDEHELLKQWYLDQGFMDVEKRKPENFPFTICYMEKQL